MKTESKALSRISYNANSAPQPTSAFFNATKTARTRSTDLEDALRTSWHTQNVRIASASARNNLLHGLSNGSTRGSRGAYVYWTSASARYEIETLREVSELEDNWDGYGALAPQPAIVATVRGILETLKTLLPTPDVTPNENGTITIEWRSRSDYASIEIGATSFAFMMRHRGNRTRFVNGELAKLDPTLAFEIDDALYWPAPSALSSDSRWAYTAVGI